MSRLTRSEAIHLTTRWDAVNEADIAELQRSTPEDNLRALAVLMQSARELGWSTKDPVEVGETRALWVRLKQVG